MHNDPVSTYEDLVQAIVAKGVHDPRLLRAMRRVPRSEFVPPNLAERAYLDQPLPIPHGQVTTQPSLVAKMIEALGLAGSEHLLEIGTGYGFQTALLAHLSNFVWSVERWSDVAVAARANLSRLGLLNVEVTVGDGTEGLAEHAPSHLTHALICCVTGQWLPIELTHLQGEWSSRAKLPICVE